MAMSKDAHSLVLMFLAVFLSTFLLIRCSGSDLQKYRDGAVCKDGTSTTATGPAACSEHGGVDHWTYEVQGREQYTYP